VNSEQRHILPILNRKMSAVRIQGRRLTCHLRHSASQLGVWGSEVGLWIKRRGADMGAGHDDGRGDAGNVLRGNAVKRRRIGDGSGNSGRDPLITTTTTLQRRSRKLIFRFGISRELRVWTTSHSGATDVQPLKPDNLVKFEAHPIQSHGAIQLANSS